MISLMASCTYILCQWYLRIKWQHLIQHRWIWFIKGQVDFAKELMRLPMHALWSGGSSYQWPCPLSLWPMWTYAVHCIHSPQIHYQTKLGEKTQRLYCPSLLQGMGKGSPHKLVMEGVLLYASTSRGPISMTLAYGYELDKDDIY